MRGVFVTAESAKLLLFVSVSWLLTTCRAAGIKIAAKCAALFSLVSDSLQFSKTGFSNGIIADGNQQNWIPSF
jgi:hypothetical protein